MAKSSNACRFSRFVRLENVGKEYGNDDLPVAFFDENNNEEILRRCGVRSRRITDKSVLDLGNEVVRKLLDTLGHRAHKIGGLVFRSCTYKDPHTGAGDMQKVAQLLARDRGIRGEIHGADFACSGFVHGALEAVSLCNKIKKPIALVTAEKNSQHTDFRDKNTGILFGDAASGVMVYPPSSAGDHAILSGAVRTHIDNDALIMLERIEDALSIDGTEGDRLCYRMHGRGVFKVASRSMRNDVQAVLESRGSRLSENVWVIQHQANRRMIEFMVEELKGNNLLEGRKLSIADVVENRGNTAAESIAGAAAEVQDDIPEGSDVIMTAVGAGPEIAPATMTSGYLHVRW